MRKQIRKWDDPILEEMCEPVDLSDPNQRMEVAALVDRMKKILLATKDGVGLAAPQVGSTKQVLVYRTSLESKDFTVMINPLLVDKGLTTIKAREGCLSYPGYEAIVERYQQVTVNWKSLSNQDESKKIEGREAIIFQHEADHLVGECAVGRVWRRSVGLDSTPEKESEKIQTDTEISSMAFFPSDTKTNDEVAVNLKSMGNDEPNYGGDAFSEPGGVGEALINEAALRQVEFAEADSQVDAALGEVYEVDEQKPVEQDRETEGG